MIHFAQQAAEAAQQAPAPDLLAVIAAVATALTTLFAWLRERQRKKNAEEAAKQAEAERDATLRGVDRATARMEAPAAKLAREELRAAQAEAGVQPAIDKRLGELRNGGGK